MLSHKHIIPVREELGPHHLPVDYFAVHSIEIVGVDHVQNNCRVVPFSSVFDVRLHKEEVFSCDVRIAHVNYEGAAEEPSAKLVTKLISLHNSPL